jgi:hypothetical protein
LPFRRLLAALELIGNIEGKTLFLISNAAHVDVPFKLPKYNYLSKWQVILDTAQPERAVEQWNGGIVKARSVMLLERA